MLQKQVKSFAPASISNLGAGYDVLGVAIDAPGDTVVARRTKERGLSFSIESPVAGLPTAAKENVAAHVASLLLSEFKPSYGIAMTLRKTMPIGSGLGSSAASSVAAAVAANA